MWDCLSFLIGLLTQRKIWWGIGKDTLRTPGIFRVSKNEKAIVRDGVRMLESNSLLSHFPAIVLL